MKSGRPKLTKEQKVMSLLRKGIINQEEAHKLSGMTRVTIWSKCKELGIKPKKARKTCVDKNIKPLLKGA